MWLSHCGLHWRTLKLVMLSLRALQTGSLFTQYNQDLYCINQVKYS